MACCMGRSLQQPYFYHRDDTEYAAAAAAALGCLSDEDDLLMYDNDYDGDDDVKSGLMLATDADPLALVDKTSVHALSSSGIYSDYTSWPLLNDCMWSAGMLPPDLKAAALPVRAVRQQESLQAMAGLEDYALDDVDTDTVVQAVDPSLISPCPHVTSSPQGARHVIDPGIHSLACLAIVPIGCCLSVCK